MKIPVELMERDQWVLWKYEDKGDGNKSKIPYRIDRQRASSVDPTHWSSFLDVWQEYRKGSWSGVGFVFSESDDYCGFDFDNCLVDGKLKPWAKPIVNTLNTYTEISPSGTGVKCIARCAVQGMRGRRLRVDDGQIEIYTQGRYFTITGDVLGEGTIRDATLEAKKLINTQKTAYQPPKPTVNKKRPDNWEERAQKYVEKYPPAISGFSGHDMTFRLVCVLINGFMADPEEAMLLLEDWNNRCDPPWEDKDLEHKIEQATQAGQRESVFGYMYEDEPEVVVDDSEYEVELEGIMQKMSIESSPMPSEVFQVPGFIGQLMKYIDSQNPRDNPRLSLIAAIAFQATLAGRKIMDESGTRTNLFIVGIAPSGGGKQAPQDCIKRISYFAGCDHMIQPKVTGDTAIARCLDRSPSVLLNMDEYGHYLRQIGAGKTSGSDSVNSTLLSLWNVQTHWSPKAMANNESNITIEQPCLSFVGWTVPHNFWENLDETFLDDGFCARLLVLDTGPVAKLKRIFSDDPPGELIDLAQQWVEFKSGEGNLAFKYPKPLRVPVTDDAEKVFARLSEQSDAIEVEPKRSVYSRMSEKARKLSLIYAASRDINNIVVDQEAANWADILVRWSTDSFWTRVQSGVGASSKINRICDKVLKFITEKEAEGKRVLRSNMMQQLRIESYDMNKVRDTLLDRDQIECDKIKQPSGRPAEVYRKRSPGGTQTRKID